MGIYFCSQGIMNDLLNILVPQLLATAFAVLEMF